MIGPCTVVAFTEPNLTDPLGENYSGGAPVDGVITKFRIYADTPSSTQVTFRVAEHQPA